MFDFVNGTKHTHAHPKILHNVYCGQTPNTYSFNWLPVIPFHCYFVGTSEWKPLVDKKVNTLIVSQSLVAI